MTRLPRRIQIQLMSPPDAVGGGAVHARGLARALRGLGAQVSLLCTGSTRPAADPAFDKIISCQPRCWPLLWRVSPLGTLCFWRGAVRAALAGADAVISLSPVMAFATRRARPDLPRLYAPASLFGTEPRGSSSRGLRWLERHVLRDTRRILLSAAAVRRAIETLCRPLNAAVGICPLGVDAGRLCHVARSRTGLGVPAGARLLLTVGPLNANKGQRAIARALAKCARPDWWWALLGSGADEAAIRGTLRGSAIETRVVFAGRDAHPADWYAAADLLVSASQSETFGLSIAEALHAGVPVVIPRDEPGSTLSPLADAVESFRLGQTYSRTDTRALADALTRTLDDEHGLAATGGRAAAFARANFSWQAYARCALQLLQDPSDITREPPTRSGALETDARPSAKTTAREPAHAAADRR